MKRVAVPASEPEVLALFRTTYPHASWDDFKNEPANQEVFDRLAVAQGHLCAYCEIRIVRPQRGQVEHFEPKSLSPDLQLRLANLLACCEGGAVRWDPDRSAAPMSQTIHCDQLKADRAPQGRMLDPRSVPIVPLIWTLTSQGHPAVNRDACATAQVDPDIAERTLTFLGLNRRVLVRKREEILTDLYEAHESEPFRPEVYLLPDPTGRLTEFWSTVRFFGGVECDPFLLANAEQIPGLSVR